MVENASRVVLTMMLVLGTLAAMAEASAVRLGLDLDGLRRAVRIVSRRGAEANSDGDAGRARRGLMDLWRSEPDPQGWARPECRSSREH
jgi:hypothetical protein